MIPTLFSLFIALTWEISPVNARPGSHDRFERRDGDVKTCSVILKPAAITTPFIVTPKFAASGNVFLAAPTIAKKPGDDEKAAITPTIFLEATYIGPVVNCSSTFTSVGHSPRTLATITRYEQSFATDIVAAIDGGSAVVPTFCFTANATMLNAACQAGYAVEATPTEKFTQTNGKVSATAKIVFANVLPTKIASLTASGFPNDQHISNGPATIGVEATYVAENITCTSVTVEPSTITLTKYSTLLASTITVSTSTSITTLKSKQNSFSAVLAVTGKPAADCPAGFTAANDIGTTVVGTVYATAVSSSTEKDDGKCTLKSKVYSGGAATVLPTSPNLPRLRLFQSTIIIIPSLR
ncbi:hypothetical protein BJ742DRAFT_877398 [Cladochytrium replicatum]|nr:hypothetical protein BJ742DRAFT_877398 [Cladochytrium replicatum]